MRAAPQAVATPMAAFDAALATRDFTIAQSALATLGKLLSENHPAVLARRANLAAARRD